MINKLVVKLGGSVFSREEKLIDFKYLLSFKELLLKFVNTQSTVGIIAGGGYTMRMYRDLAKNEGHVENQTDLHWIGTTTNVLHAEIIRTIFGELAEPRPLMYDDYYSENQFDFKKNFVMGGGGKPGHSGDVDAILFAKKIGSKEVISLKNIQQVCSGDPKIYPDARPIDKISWKEYLNIIGNPTEHTPGGNFPIDPIASRMGMEEGITFTVLSGFDLTNFESYLNGEKFIGTVIY